MTLSNKMGGIVMTAYEDLFEAKYGVAVRCKLLVTRGCMRMSCYKSVLLSVFKHSKIFLLTWRKQEARKRV